MELTDVKEIISRSSELSKHGHYQPALTVLDEAISAAAKSKHHEWVCTFARHASVIAERAGNLGLARHYREQCVALNPDDALALCDLALTLERIGEKELGRNYATKSFKITNQMGDDRSRAIVDSLLRIWPDLSC